MFERTNYWEIIGATAAGITLFLYILKDVAWPYIRGRIFKSPVKAHFVFRKDGQGKEHISRSIVLPANSTTEIEIGYYPRLSFHLNELTFFCEGERGDKPEATQVFRNFIASGKNRHTSPSNSTDYIDIHGGYHTRPEAMRSFGTHYTIGFKLKTRKPGIYPLQLFFATDERSGKFRLTIIVEKKPKTDVPCHQSGHGWSCRVKPVAN